MVNKTVQIVYPISHEKKKNHRTHPFSWKEKEKEGRWDHDKQAIIINCLKIDSPSPQSLKGKEQPRIPKEKATEKRTTKNRFEISMETGGFIVTDREEFKEI